MAKKLATSAQLHPPEELPRLKRLLEPLTLADAEIAIDRGDSHTLARYLRETPSASLAPVIIRNIADMLSPRPGFSEKWRLEFKRSRAGNPTNEIEATVQEASIGHEVEALYRERLSGGTPKRGLRKSVIGEVAKNRELKDGTVRKAWEAVRKINKRKMASNQSN